MSVEDSLVAPASAATGATRWLVAIIVLLVVAVGVLGRMDLEKKTTVTTQTIQSQDISWLENAQSKIASQWGPSGGFATCGGGPSDGADSWTPGSEIDCELYNASGTPYANSQGNAYCAMAVIMLPNGGVHVETSTNGDYVCAN